MGECLFNHTTTYKEECVMKKPLHFLLAGALCLALGTVAVVDAKDGILSTKEVTKIVAQKVGSDVQSITLHSTKGGHYYYRLTVDNTPDDEVKDVYVDARNGKIEQVIEHPGDMMFDTFPED